MKTQKQKTGEAGWIKNKYLRRLGKLLLLFFPAGQTWEILTDYEGYVLLEEGQSAETFIRRWGTPEQVLRTLLEENSGAVRYFGKQAVLWGALAAAAFACAASMQGGIFAAQILLPLACLGFLHGREQIKVEGEFPHKEAGKRWAAAAGGLMFVLVAMTEAQIQYLLKYIETIPPYVGRFHVGKLLDRELIVCGMLALGLAVWMAKQAVTASVLYLAGAVHAVGALLFLMEVRSYLRSLDISALGEWNQVFWFPVLYYGIGAGVSLGIWAFLRAGRRTQSRGCTA
ncbi:MAG: hypothetical protein HFE83_06880 [Lachnospiraceae bacterium]|nr:hypothetical protein [Lachnospiraceae bacterium]